MQVKRMLEGRCAPLQRDGGTPACRPAHSAVQHADQADGKAQKPYGLSATPLCGLPFGQQREKRSSYQYVRTNIKIFKRIEYLVIYK